jgi:hypothetical protein
MLLVREVFIAKPGHAGELSRMMKENMKGMPASMNAKVMLDSVTDYNKIVLNTKLKVWRHLNRYESGKSETSSKKKANQRTKIYRLVSHRQTRNFPNHLIKSPISYFI